ncbi:MAG: hypothetical protein COA50_00265 [Flavobacteriaceae bacterium]|nr:MAG: hypothetical protein COA50_00265 [Flavobacteriaceae bacterium]
MDDSQIGAIGLFLMIGSMIILGINAIFNDISKNGFFGFMMVFFIVGLYLFWNSGGFNAKK